MERKDHNFPQKKSTFSNDFGSEICARAKLHVLIENDTIEILHYGYLDNIEESRHVEMVVTGGSTVYFKHIVTSFPYVPCQVVMFPLEILYITSCRISKCEHTHTIKGA